MDRQTVLEFVKRHPVSHMATVEDGRPRVRAMQTAIADEAGLTFCTGSHKDVARQLRADPSVELSYWDPDDGRQIRIRGDVEQLDDVALKTQVVEQVFTFLKPVVKDHGYDAISLFRLSHGEIRVWDRATGHAAPNASPF